MSWPKRVPWLGIIAGVVIAIVLLIVGITAISKTADSASKQMGDTYNKASEE